MPFVEVGELAVVEPQEVQDRHVEVLERMDRLDGLLVEFVGDADPGDVAWKLQPWHITSPLGDEIIEREGLQRISYARNELALGVSVDLGGEARAYAEAGWGFSVGDPNDPWRAQVGAELVVPLGRPAVGFFGAANLTAFQEIDWDVQFAAQAGLWIRPSRWSRGLRVGVEYFRGHSPGTQFFLRHEHYGSFGVWMHF